MMVYSMAAHLVLKKVEYLGLLLVERMAVVMALKKVDWMAFYSAFPSVVMSAARRVIPTVERMAQLSVVVWAEI